MNDYDLKGPKEGWMAMIHARLQSENSFSLLPNFHFHLVDDIFSDRCFAGFSCTVKDRAGKVSTFISTIRSPIIDVLVG